MGLFQWFGIALFIFAAFLMIGSSPKTQKKVNIKSFVLLILLFASNGAIMILQKYFALKVQSGNVALFSLIAFASAAVFMLLISLFLPKTPKLKQMPSDTKKRLALYGALLALAVFVIGQLVTVLAKTVPSAILFPVSSAIALIAGSAAGAIFFKEKMTLLTVLGILLAIIATVLLNL